MNNKQNNKTIFVFYLKGIIKFAIILIFIFFAVRLFVLAPGKIDGQSMEPNYVDEDIFLVNKVSYLATKPKRFDVVQVVDQHEGKERIVKRIIGLPEETIQIKRGRVYLQKKGETEFTELDESAYLDEIIYTQIPAQKGVAEFKIGENEYFLLGDNRRLSTDCRQFGPVHRSMIIGRAIKIL